MAGEIDQTLISFSIGPIHVAESSSDAKDAVSYTGTYRRVGKTRFVVHDRHYEYVGTGAMTAFFTGVLALFGRILYEVAEIALTVFGALIALAVLIYVMGFLVVEVPKSIRGWTDD